ncbi:hypothetical protein K443DRAFT_679424 [Laccaria amethystina LaAM-08-1]|uniref:Unplaced genomic scaffold K443scaffold_97, whole genome shotgun sequence n=1 Tax=Laccaria amethystina LaAM-08-1 TaxID=1095629 RepID=A0A0C9WPX2_9AGAR|nr:hypothetical protein K443DRAFT_679424 [Laccaria amethystina LaAM-08-1]
MPEATVLISASLPESLSLLPPLSLLGGVPSLLSPDLGDRLPSPGFITILPQMSSEASHFLNFLHPYPSTNSLTLSSKAQSA